MNFRDVMRLIGKWGGTLKFFPSDPDARLGIAQEIASMASNEAQVEWLVAQVAKIYTEWPGALEIRAVFCTHYRPADGAEASLGTSSAAYPALCAEEAAARPQLTAPHAHQIAGEVQSVTADSEMQELVRKVSAKRPDAIRNAPAVTPDEIEQLKQAQERNRRENLSEAELRAAILGIMPEAAKAAKQ